MAAPNIDVHCPIRGIMTTRGCILSDPGIPNRHSIWFTGGRIEPDDDRGINAVHWKHQFALHPPKPSSLTQRAKILATNWFMGATLSDTLLVDGAMEYAFARPIGGHGVAFVDTLYVDETLRIVRGHRGTIYVFTRVGDMKT